MDNCIFCQIISGSLPAHKIWENKHFLAFLDINPVNPGHTLLVPKIHVDEVFDLEEPLYHELFQISKFLSGPLKRALETQRVGVVIEGFEVPHTHVHLVPINKGNELDPHRAKSATKEELAAIAESIRQTLARG